MAQDFLKDVLPSTGVFVQWSDKKQNFFDSHNDLISANLNISGRQRNAYYATASFKDKTNRKRSNASQKKALYVDIDIDPNDPDKYSTFKDALQALLFFCQMVGIPEPTWVVMSGSGLHAYWALTKAVSVDAWSEVAAMLKSACVAKGLKADHACTQDVVRILRMPGTQNWKDPKNPKTVQAKKIGSLYPLQRFKSALSNHVSAGFKLVHNLPGGLNDDLSGGLEYSPKFAKHIASECLVLRDAVQTGGAGHDEPMWSSILHLLAFCEDGKDFIHGVSNKHPGYRAKDTEYKFQTKLDNKDTTGPTSCQHFKAASPLCRSCKHNGVITTPLSLGVPPTNPQDPPNPWIVQANGVFVDVDGQKQRIINLGIDKVELFGVTADSGMRLGMDWHTTTNKQNGQVMIPLDVIKDNRSLATFLPKNGIAVEKDDTLQLGRLLDSWAHRLQENGQVQTSVDGYGWIDKGHTLGFSHGEKTFWSGGEVTQSLAIDPVYRTMYTPKGSDQVWRNCVSELMQRGDMAIYCALATAFAAPLVRFSGIEGGTVSIMSPESGTGKSTAIKIASAVYGNPALCVNRLNDTANSVVHKLAAGGSLPAYWDEVRMPANARQFVQDVVFRLSEGKDKGRLNRDSTYRGTRTWKTLLTVGTNESLSDIVLENVQGSNAGILRLLELRVESVPAGAKALQLGQKVTKLEENYGHIGEQYVQWLVQNTATAEKIIGKLCDDLAQEVTDPVIERFRIATAACLLAGAAFANKLGFTTFPLDDMKQFIIDNLCYNYDTTLNKAANSLGDLPDLIEEYMNELSSQIYHAQNVPLHASWVSPTPTNQGYGNVVHQPERTPIIGVYGEENKGLQLVAQPFWKWIKDRGLHRASVKKMMDDYPAGIDEGRRIFGMGLPNYKESRLTCITFDLDQIRT